ncbi:MAG: TonB-dependent receptor [Myxococcaceae bacterium]|nr:TonB-dependent receptor [Myxococcaceae bacterium]
MRPATVTRSAPRAALAAALLLLGRGAAAQTADEAEARRLFDRGVALIDADRPTEAIALLERARRIREVPAVVYNLALAQSAVGRFADALASFDAYLRLAGPRLPADRRAAVDGLIARAHESMAAVTLRVVGAGVTVSVDDVALPPERWSRPLELDGGRHVFQATGPGLRPVEVTRYLVPGVRAEIELAPAPLPATATLRVASLVAGASIFLDGALVGVGSVERPAAPGRHTVALRADGYDPSEQVVQLAPGGVEQLRLSLRPHRTVLSQWWFWTGVGVVATAVVAGLVVGLSSTEAPAGGSAGFVVEASTGR